MSRKEALMNKLTSSSLKYNEIQNELFNFNSLQEIAQKNVKRHEYEIELVVQNTKGNDGKKLYTNESQRKAAIHKIKDNNDLYQDYLKEYTDVTNKIRKCVMELDILKFQQRNNLKLVQLELSMEEVKNE